MIKYPSTESSGILQEISSRIQKEVKLGKGVNLREERKKAKRGLFVKTIRGKKGLLGYTHDPYKDFQPSRNYAYKGDLSETQQSD